MTTVTIPTAGSMTKRTSGPSPWTLAFANLKKDRRAWPSAGVLLILTLAVFIGPLFLPDFEAQILENQLAAPSWSHWMGTDHLGRDVLSRV